MSELINLLNNGKFLTKRGELSSKGRKTYIKLMDTLIEIRDFTGCNDEVKVIADRINEKCGVQF